MSPDCAFHMGTSDASDFAASCHKDLVSLPRPSLGTPWAFRIPFWTEYSASASLRMSLIDGPCREGSGRGPHAVSHHGALEAVTLLTASGPGPQWRGRLPPAAVDADLEDPAHAPDAIELEGARALDVGSDSLSACPPVSLSHQGERAEQRPFGTRELRPSAHSTGAFPPHGRCGGGVSSSSSGRSWSQRCASSWCPCVPSPPPASTSRRTSALLRFASSLVAPVWVSFFCLVIPSPLPRPIFTVATECGNNAVVLHLVQ